MKVKQITESTTAGAVATVAAPLGGTQKRAGSMFKGKKTNKPFYEDGTEVSGLVPAEKVVRGKAKKKGPYANSVVAEGKIKELSQDLKELSDTEFKKKYGQTKAEWRASLKKVDEAEITEQDLIVVPGMRRMKDKSFVSHKEDRRDHEVEMARSDLYATAKNAMRIFDLLKDRTEDEGLMGWQQSYITLAADYLNSVADSIEYNAKVKGELDEMTGGVIAGGMSNFEEDAVNELSPATKKSYAALAKQDKEFNQRGIDQALSRAAADQHPGSAEWEDEAEFLKKVNAKRDRGLARAGVSEDSNELDQQARAVADKLTTGKNLEKLRGKVYDSTVYRALDRYFEKHNIPETIYNRVAQIVFQRINQQGVAESSEEKLDEKKDACYSKVKSRYKVWPSAYASGALVKCRKVGAANWGNKSKK